MAQAERGIRSRPRRRPRRSHLGPPAPRWWTRERLLSGLRRAAEEVYRGDPSLLPRDGLLYAHDTAPACKYKPGPRRRYPPAHQVYRHFPSLTHAWHALGLVPEEQLYTGPQRWWTPARMIEAGADFFREFGVAPTNDAWWQEMTAGTALTPTGENSNRPEVNRFPSCTTVQAEWGGMRAAPRSKSDKRKLSCNVLIYINLYVFHFI